MSLWCFRKNKHRELRHAGMAGRHQVRGIVGDIIVAWISALHAGMRELRSRTETDPDSRPLCISKALAVD